MSARCASYLVGENVYWVTTIHWVNDLTGCDWNETGIRNMESPRDFVLVQHDIWPLEAGHREIIRRLRLGATPDSLKYVRLVETLKDELGRDTASPSEPTE